MRRRTVALAVGTAVLSGCAAVAPAPPDLTGRIALRVDATATTPPRSFSADFDLRGGAERGVLRLTGPLGATLAEVRWQPGRAELSDGQGTRDYPTLDAMSQDLFGEPLPLLALLDWMRGRPWPDAASRATDSGFDQLGWSIGLTGFDAGLVVATRERAPGILLRARVEKPA